jgi:two-component system, NarL family, response regulator NreC
MRATHPTVSQGLEMGRIKVLLVDNHEIFRRGVHKLLAAKKNIHVVGEASDGHEAIEKAGRLRPDVVIVDPRAPGLGGMEAAQHLKDASPESHVLILSMHDHKETVTQAIRKGASGYVVKQASSADLVRAIRTVYDGKRYLSPSLSFSTTELAGLYALHDRGDSSRPPLTNREKEVLRFVSEGFLNKQIAAELGISVKTVEVHKHHIMCKLQLFSTAELTKYAVRSGLTNL